MNRERPTCDVLASAPQDFLRPDGLVWITAAAREGSYLIHCCEGDLATCENLSAHGLLHIRPIAVHPTSRIIGRLRDAGGSPSPLASASTNTASKPSTASLATTAGNLGIDRPATAAYLPPVPAKRGKTSCPGLKPRLFEHL